MVPEDDLNWELDLNCVLVTIAICLRNFTAFIDDKRYNALNIEKKIASHVVFPHALAWSKV